MEGIDDFASMREVLSRRFTHGQGESKEKKNRFARDPDLILIDGGRGQLNAALTVLCELNLERFPIVSLAKREEEIYLPEREEPLKLDPAQ